MHSTNYFDAFITIAPDCPAALAQAPEDRATIAGLQYDLLRERPYVLTSDDLLFEVHRRRNALGDAELAEARGAFFGKPQACLRASPLAKRHGWGFHHDGEGRVALAPVESETYRTLSRREDLKVVPAMRNKRVSK